MKGKSCFLSFFLFVVSDNFSFFSSIFNFLAVILSFIQPQSKHFLSLLLLLLNHLAVFITFFLFIIIFFLLFSRCLVLFNMFSHSSLQTFLFHSFGILFRYDIVLFF